MGGSEPNGSKIVAVTPVHPRHTRPPTHAARAGQKIPTGRYRRSDCTYRRMPTSHTVHLRPVVEHRQPLPKTNRSLRLTVRTRRMTEVFPPASPTLPERLERSQCRGRPSYRLLDTLSAQGLDDRAVRRRKLKVVQL